MIRKKSNFWDWWFMAGMLIIILALATSCSESTDPKLVSYFKKQINELHTAINTKGNLKGIYSELKYAKSDVIDKYADRKIIEEVFGDKSQVFIDQFKRTWPLYDNWYNKIGTLEKDISDYKSRIKDADENNFYLSYLKARRFDTYGSKGMYEAYSTNMYQMVVIVSEPEKIVINSLYPNEVYVKADGQKEMVVTHTNAFRSWDTKEYYNTYETVSDWSNPSYLKKKLAEATAHLEKNKSQFTTSKTELRFQAEMLDDIIKNKK